MQKNWKTVFYQIFFSDWLRKRIYRSSSRFFPRSSAFGMSFPLLSGSFQKSPTKSSSNWVPTKPKNSRNNSTIVYIALFVYRIGQNKLHSNQVRSEKSYFDRNLRRNFKIFWIFRKKLAQWTISTENYFIMEQSYASRNRNIEHYSKTLCIIRYNR